MENLLAPFQGLDASKVKVVNCNRRKSLPPASVALLDGGTAKAIGETAKFLKEQGKVETVLPDYSPYVSAKFVTE